MENLITKLFDEILKPKGFSINNISLKKSAEIPFVDGSSFEIKHYYLSYSSNDRSGKIPFEIDATENEIRKKLQDLLN